MRKGGGRGRRLGVAQNEKASGASKAAFAPSRHGTAPGSAPSLGMNARPPSGRPSGGRHIASAPAPLPVVLAAGDGEHLVRFPRFDAEGVKHIREIPGRRWSPGEHKCLPRVHSRQEVDSLLGAVRHLSSVSNRDLSRIRTPLDELRGDEE